jgi:hypothetical protein
VLVQGERRERIEEEKRRASWAKELAHMKQNGMRKREDKGQRPAREKSMGPANVRDLGQKFKWVVLFFF